MKKNKTFEELVVGILCRSGIEKATAERELQLMSEVISAFLRLRAGIEEEAKTSASTEETVQEIDCLIVELISGKIDRESASEGLRKMHDRISGWK